MKYNAPVPAYFQWTLEINLQEDFKSMLNNELIGMGYLDADEDKMIEEYFNIQKSRVSSWPRKVALSKELVCPKGMRLR